MTPAERAVIDAARAYEREFGALVDELDPSEPTAAFVASSALVRAVRALPRPLSEQLAELRPGAVVDSDGPYAPYRVVANVASHGELVCEYRDSTETRLALVPYRHIRRVISNPEADRG